MTTRVFLPPVDEWENRSGPHFGFRLALETTAMVDKEVGIGIFKRTKREMGNEIYWPGMFIEFESKSQTRKPDDYAYLARPQQLSRRRFPRPANHTHRLVDTGHERHA